MALSKKHDRIKVSSMCVTLLTYVNVVACSSLVVYLFLAELSRMTKFSALSDSSKIRSIPPCEAEVACGGCYTCC
jgi:hypothetical protein